MRALEDFLTSLMSVPGVDVHVDRLAFPSSTWLVHVERRGATAVAQWSPRSGGFGITRSGDFGLSKKDVLIVDPAAAKARVLALIGAGA